MQTYADRPWLKHMDPKIPREYDFPESPVHQLLTNSFRQFPDNVALYYYGTEFTYSELESLTNKFANALISLGVNPGDRVALFMDNSPQYVISFFSVLKVGAVVVQVSPLAVERDLRMICADCRPRGIITLDYLSNRIKSLLEDKQLEFAVISSLLDYLPVNPFPAHPFGVQIDRAPVSSLPGIYDFRSLLNQLKDFTPPIIRQHDLALLQYTSGTTGTPKGVMITHYNLVTYVWGLILLDYKNEPGREVYPVTLPMSHNYAMFQTVVAPLAMGGKVVIMVRFHPEEALKVIHALKPTIFRAVPIMFNFLVHYPGLKAYDLSSVRHWVVGGAPVPEELIKKFGEVSGANVIEGYGLTESTSGVVLDCYYAKTGLGMGFPAPYLDVRVVNPETGQDVAVGKEGELLMKGPTISPGYWERPEETEKTFRDGWLHTGDIVRMTEQGVLQFVDRLKELIIVSGYNVYPTEVENVLYEHPAVFEAAVIGFPDERQGEYVKAVIALKPGAQVEKQEIIDFCRERLSPYKVPKIVEFVEQLPKNPTGKILKKELRQR